jgi:maltose alpha-D-glucosyltransferase/alpha-amylase
MRDSPRHPARGLVRPAIARGDFGFREVNVMRQRSDQDALLTWFARLISIRRECPEIGEGQAGIVDVELPRSVLAHRIDEAAGSLLFLHNLADTPVEVKLGQVDGVERIEQVFCSADGGPLEGGLSGIELAGYGYRWIRISRHDAW